MNPLPKRLHMLMLWTSKSFYRVRNILKWRHIFWDKFNSLEMKINIRDKLGLHRGYVTFYMIFYCRYAFEFVLKY